MFKSVKRNTRLCIVNDEKVIAYTPPNFLRNKIRSRDELDQIVDAFNLCEEYPIRSIIDFESKFW